MAKTKRSKKGKGKYLKYRNGPGNERPQRTGANKESGKDTGSAGPRAAFRRKKVSRLVDMCASHSDPAYAVRSLVPAHLVSDVVLALSEEGVKI